MLLLHGSKVHGLLDDVVVIQDLVFVDGLLKGPGVAVVLHVVEEVEEGVVVGAVAGGAGEFVHDGGPAGVFDGKDGEGVDGFEFPLCPLGWWRMDLVALAYCHYFGVCAFFLLEQHSAGFEVADLWDHAALHNGAAFVVLDVAHPSRLFQCNFLGEALFLEVSNSVVVGVGEKVHDFGCGFDIVLQMRHEMGTIAFDLLVR